MTVNQIKNAIHANFLQIKSTAFLRSVVVLVGGTAFAQGLILVTLPVITRLYAPEDFSVLAVYSSIAVIFTVVACLRLEIAIPLPEDDEDAANLLALAIISCTLLSAIVALVILFFGHQIALLIDQPALHPHLWMLAPTIWIASIYVALTFWATRHKQFAAVSKTRITQAFSSITVQIGFAVLTTTGPMGLLVGQIVNGGAGAFGLGKNAFIKQKTALSKISFRGMRSTLIEYKRFPKYSTLDALASSGSNYLPVIIIAATATGPDAGYLLLATRAMAVPLALLGGAISQVYLSQAPSELRDGRLDAFTTDVISGLAKSGIGPLIFMGIAASHIFPLVFGNAWGPAGQYVIWMTPWFVMQFLSTPVSMAMHITGSLTAALMLQIFGLLLRVSTVTIAGLWAPHYLIETYAVSGFIFYATHLIVVGKTVRIGANGALKIIKSSAAIIIAWALSGVLVLETLRCFRLA